MMHQSTPSEVYMGHFFAENETHLKTVSAHFKSSEQQVLNRSWRQYFSLIFFVASVVIQGYNAALASFVLPLRE